MCNITLCGNSNTHRLSRSEVGLSVWVLKKFLVFSDLYLAWQSGSGYELWLMGKLCLCGSHCWLFLPLQSSLAQSVLCRWDSVRSCFCHKGPHRLEARETSSPLAMHQADWQQMADYQLLHSIINSLLKSHWISDTGGLMCYYRGQIIQWENWQLWKSKMISLSLKFLFNIPVFAEIKSTLTKSASTEQVSSSNAAYCCVGLHKGVFIFWVNTPQCSQKRYMVSEQSNSTIQTLEVTNV